MIEIKKPGESIQLSEDIYRRIVETADEGIWIGDPHGKTLFVNQKMAEMLGYSREEMIGRNGLDLVGLGQKDSRLANKRQAGSESTSIEREYRLRRKDGSDIWTLVNASPLFDAKGKYLGNLMMHTEITELKRLEEALSRAKEDLENKVRKRTLELQNAKEQLELYAREIVRVQEEERKRIARELHDETAQDLALLTLELDSILEGKARLPKSVRERIKKLRDDADRAQKEVRLFSHELRPGVLDYLGLQAALEGLVSDFNTKGPVTASLEIEGIERRLPPDVELALFRIAQEALNNCRKHSQATQAFLKLRIFTSKVRMTVSDNGKGFNVREGSYAAMKNGRLGLISMKERAQFIGASLKIRSAAGKGTTVSVEVPA